MRSRAAILLVGLMCFAPFPAASAFAQRAAQAQSKPLGEPFTIKPGESASIGAERVQVSFERVVSDSRCPKDVQCIQAGEAVIRIQLTIPGREREMVELSTAHERESAAVGGYVLSLTALDPVPLAANPPKASDYRATLVLRRN